LLAFRRGLLCHECVLCLDIRHYFLAIDHAILLGLMQRRIKDEQLLGLLGVIIASGRGLYRPSPVREFLGLDMRRRGYAATR
jgi:hypothetical protein